MADEALEVKVVDGGVQMGAMTVRFMRTLRVPQDGGVYPLPAAVGTFPVFRVDDYTDRVPAHWRGRGGVFVPMWQREALWLGFSGLYADPCALLVGAGKICAVTGQPWSGHLTDQPQNYVVVGGPAGQRWLDGFKTGDGHVSQFVATALGEGTTVEAQLTGREETGGLQLQAFGCRLHRRPFVEAQPFFVPLPYPVVRTEPVPQRPAPWQYGPFDPNPTDWSHKVWCGGSTMLQANGATPVDRPFACNVGDTSSLLARSAKGAELGLSAGGSIMQAVLNAGAFNAAAFDPKATGRVFVHIVNSAMFKAITGQDAPATPVTPEEYQRRGLPWFSDYAEERHRDLKVQRPLAAVRTVEQMDALAGKPSQEAGPTGPALLGQQRVVVLGKRQVRDGGW